MNDRKYIFEVNFPFNLSLLAKKRHHNDIHNASSRGKSV